MVSKRLYAKSQVNYGSLTTSWEENARLVDLGIFEQSAGDGLDDTVERRALLLQWNGVVEVLIPEFLNSRRQVAKEDYPIDVRDRSPDTNKKRSTHRRCSRRPPRQSQCWRHRRYPTEDHRSSRTSCSTCRMPQYQQWKCAD